MSVVDPSTKATVGHLPKKISKVCLLLLRRGGIVRCEVTGGRSYSNDLPQGGLEISLSPNIYWQTRGHIKTNNSSQTKILKYIINLIASYNSTLWLQNQ